VPDPTDDAAAAARGAGGFDLVYVRALPGDTPGRRGSRPIDFRPAQ
jgi:hypothetical protein